MLKFMQRWKRGWEEQTAGIREDASQSDSESDHRFSAVRMAKPLSDTTVPQFHVCNHCEWNWSYWEAKDDTRPGGWRFMSDEFNVALNNAYERGYSHVTHKGYTYDLVSLTQTNQQTQRVRNIVREWTYRGRAIMRHPDHRDRILPCFHALTTRWIESAPAETARLREVSKRTQEWKAVQDIFIHNTGNKRQVWAPTMTRLRAYENPFAALRYELRKHQCVVERGYCNEVMAFHGTGDIVPERALVHGGGLDTRYARESPPLYFGRGVYVTQEAEYVDRHYAHEVIPARNTRKRKRAAEEYSMICVKALVGEYKYHGAQERSPEMRVAPLGYDSVYGFTDDVHVPMFVLHDNAQIYCAYIIDYCLE